MSKYNVKNEKVVKKTVTHEGGSGYTQRPEAELIGILSTGIQNTFYEKESERETRLKNVIDELIRKNSKNKEFVAKALVYARSVFGQRTVSHLGSVNLLPYLSGDPLGKRFFSKRDKIEKVGGIIYRLDDMNEILACYLAKNGKDAPIPNSIKKGFKEAIENSDAYELAKYQMKGNSISLVDIVNLVHPKESAKNGYIDVPKDTYLKATSGTKFTGREYEELSDGNIRVPALRALVLGVLKQLNTAEDKNTQSGKEVAEKVKSGELTKEKAVEVLNEKKTENFKELIETKKIGYLALIRNLRNILKTGDWDLLDKACNLLVNKDFIRKSLVWPHQIDLALEIMLNEFSGREMQKVSKFLGVAYELSIPNLEKLLPEGKTAIVYDTSGSMTGGWHGVQIPSGGKIVTTKNAPIEKAALVAATFAKGVAGDVYHFGTSCKAVTSYNPNDSINTIKNRFKDEVGKAGHGTNYESILPTLAQNGGSYDRIVIITDEQGHDNFERSYNKYKDKYGTPYVYFINICGYAPTMIKSGSRVFRLYGYSSDIYEKIPQLELNVNEVIDAINRIEI
ncbi:MAG: hypothetical protein ACOC1K_01615 [Nanoarchaeota archaeon]